jgi:hypothetical protein
VWVSSRSGGYLSRGVTRTALRELLDHTFEIRIAGAKAPCKPVSTALRNLLAVSDHLELTGLTKRKDGFNVEALFDEGHETRDLDLVVLSRRAVNDLDLHLFSILLRVQCSFTRGAEEFAEELTIRIRVSL